MPPVDLLTAFVIASVLLALAPGPDNIFVLTQSIVNGAKAGILVTLGLSTGLLFHTSAVAFGLAALFNTSATLFNAVKITGAIYLLYLAWLAFKAPSGKIHDRQGNELTDLRYYLRGIVMNVTNPKVTIFFLAFLPQFTNPGYGPVIQQVFILGTIFMIVTMIVFGSIAMLAGMIGSWLNSWPGLYTILNRMAGMVFIGMALKLATTRFSS